MIAEGSSSGFGDTVDCTQLAKFSVQTFCFAHCNPLDVVWPGFWSGYSVAPLTMYKLFFFFGTMQPPRCSRAQIWSGVTLRLPLWTALYSKHMPPWSHVEVWKTAVSMHVID